MINTYRVLLIDRLLSSQRTSAEKHLSYARNHRAIENNLHWILDIMFNDDRSLIRKNNAAENISAVRKMVINTLKNLKLKPALRLE